MKGIPSNTLAFATTVMAIVGSSIGTAQAQWHPYKVYPVSGIGSKPSQALAVNSYNHVAGRGDYTNNPYYFTGMFGGASIVSSFSILPSNWMSLEFNAMNNNGQAVGLSMVKGHPTAVSYQPGGILVDMTADIKNTFGNDAVGINSSGIAVGHYHLQGVTGTGYHMFRWDDAIQKRTGDWADLMAGGINENGLMVACNLKPTNYWQSQELALVPPSGPTKFVTAPGDYIAMVPSGVSTYGGITVTGEFATAYLNQSNTHKRGFAYNQGTNEWSALAGPGGMDYETDALGIDVWGTRIVGYMLDGNGIQSGAVWQWVNGQWVESNLSDVFPSDPNWTYSAATAINPLGAISGYGQHLENGKWVQRAFIAVPGLWRIRYPEGPILGGNILNASVYVDGLDPHSLTYQLASDSRLIRIPREVRIPGGHNTTSVAIETDGVDVMTPVTISTSLGGAATDTRLLLAPAVLYAIAIDSNSDGIVGHVTLNGKAGPSSAAVKLTSSNPNVTVPATLKIAPNTSFGSFRINVGRGVDHGTVVTITAHLMDGSVSQTFKVH